MDTIHIFDTSSSSEMIQQLLVIASARWSPIVMFTSSLILSWLWYGNSNGDHPVSFGVAISVMCFCFGRMFVRSFKMSVFSLVFSDLVENADNQERDVCRCKRIRYAVCLSGKILSVPYK